MKIRITKSSKKANKERQTRTDRENMDKQLYQDIRTNGCPNCKSKSIYINSGLMKFKKIRYECGCWDCHAEWTAYGGKIKKGMK